MSFQLVCLAVSSIPVWSVLAGPWAFGTFFVVLQTVIAAGVLFSGGSSCSHGPLNNFSFSTVRIISLLDVISINSVVGQVACISLKVCVLLFFSSCLAFAALVLYLLIASRTVFMSIGIRPLGVFCFVVHRWQNQSWGGIGPVCVRWVCIFCGRLDCILRRLLPLLVVQSYFVGVFLFCTWCSVCPVLAFGRGG